MSKRTEWTTRRILRHLRETDPRSLYKTVTDRDTGENLIVSKPDFDVVPYDKNRDYWGFVASVTNAVSDLHLDETA